MEAETLRQRLREGDRLEMLTGGGAYEVWAEPFASPPSIYFEGERYDLKDLDAVLEKILSHLREDGVRCRWVED